MEIHQTQVREWLEQNKETLISEFSNNPELIHPWTMEQLSEWESDKETPHEITCQMYEYLLQILETFVELPPSLSSKEVWKSGAEIGLSRYEISSHGRVKNVRAQTCFVGNKRHKNYIRYYLMIDDNTKKWFRAHTLTAMLFIPNPDNKPSVDHINRIGNDNRCLNLRWATASEQALNREKRKIKCHAVYQYDLEDNFIKRWNSAKEVLTEMSGSIARLMNACSKGLIYRDFRWYYDYLIEVDEEEKWRPSYLEGYEDFEISSKGRIRRSNGKIHDGNENDEYRVINLYNQITKEYDQYKIQVLVATVFLGKHEGLVVNHKNGNKHDNRIENLEFVTQSENVLHAHETGLIKIRRPVLQIDKKNSSVIAQYKSITEAELQTGIDRSSISTVCQGLQGLAGGYKWKYVDDEGVKKRITGRVTRAVRQLDKDTGKLIAEFSSIREAALQVEINRTNIGHACSGRTKTAGGFRWEYI